jgi:hypothetical protein
MPTIIVGYDEHRPWHEKWRDVQDGLEQIENAYAATESDGYYGNERVRRVVEGFFKDCRELADWLWHDHQSTGLEKSTVLAAVMSDPDLRVADGFAQTIKHHTRRATKVNPDPITARIIDISVGAGGSRAFIDWRGGGGHGREDALNLARRCVDAWKRFLAGSGSSTLR